MKITHINPATLHANPTFSQAVRVEGPADVVYVGGQNAVDAEGRVVGGDLHAQTTQALHNVLAALDAVGAAQDSVLKLTVHVVAGHDLAGAFQAAREVWGRHATAITVLVVAGLANPAFLVEVDAVAAVPAG